MKPTTPLVWQVLVLGWSLHAYWQAVAGQGPGGQAPASGGGGGGSVHGSPDGMRSHLRVFLLLRCLSLALGELGRVVTLQAWSWVVFWEGDGDG